MTKGPFSFQNWQHHLLKEPWQEIHEYPLFTDAWIVGEVTEGLGPYQLINNVSLQSGRPAVILRVERYRKSDLLDMERTQEESYHGGLEEDEIAALVSLCLGIRLKAGGENRSFSKGGDPMGRPIGYSPIIDPELPIMSDKRNAILGNALATHNLDKTNPLTFYPLLSPQNATNLVRSARLYQEAIWIVESSPELAWILLVSAIETVSSDWSNSENTPIEKMRVSRPNIEKILRRYGGNYGDELVLEVANEIAPYMGSGKAFRDFIIEFLPDAPSLRPPVFATLSWEKSKMKKTLEKIYSYRSRALHGGHPFPAPMCYSPLGVGENRELEEIPLGSAMGSKGSVWLAKDTPMLFHTFEYIARNAILKWWISTKSKVPS